MSQLNQSRNSSMDGGGPGFIHQNQNLMQHKYQQHPTVQQPTPAPQTGTLPSSNSNSHPQPYALQRTNSVTYSTTNATNNINQDSSNNINNVQNTNNTTFSGTNITHPANRANNVSQSTSNLSCSTSASSIRSYSESPPPEHIILQNQIVYNAISSTNSNNRRISISPASPTTSLTSRTFDLEREFSGTGDDEGGHGNKGKGVSRGEVKNNYHLNNDIQEFKSQSSSPSVEDTIIARGVTYTADPAVARQPHLILSPRYQSIQHQQQNQGHNHHNNYNQNSNSSMQGQGQGQGEHTQNNTNHNHIQNTHPYLVTKDSIGSTDELLSVDVRQFQNDEQNQYRAQLIQPNQIQSQSHNHYNHQTQVQQINDLTDDEDSLSILNNYKHYQTQKQQHQQQHHHHHDDNTTYVVKTGAGTGIGTETRTGAGPGPGKTQNYYSPGAKMITRQRAEERETTPPSLKSTILDLDDETFRGLKAGVDSPPVPHVNGYGKSFRQRHPNQMPSSELHHHAVQDGTRIYKTQIPNQNQHQNHNNLNHQPNHQHNHGTGKHVQFSLKNRYCKSKTHFAPNLSLTDILSKIFLGNSPLVRDILEKKQYKVRWSPIIFLECFFRSVSAVSLAPNPLSGALIFIAMLIITPLGAMLGSLALISGILTAIFLVQMPLELVRSGGVTFNSYLLGTAIGELSSEDIWKDRVDIFALSIALGSLIIFVCCGLDGIVSRRGAVRLPLLNSPFNLTALLYVTSGLAGLYKAGTTTDLSPPFQGIDLRFGIDGNNLSVTPLPGSIPAIPNLNANTNPNPNSDSNNNGDPGISGIPGDAGDFRGISLLSLNNIPSNSGAVPGSSYGADTLSLGLGSYDSNNKNQSINLTLWDMPDNLGFEPPQSPENITIDWALVLQGVLLAPSQFYGTKTMWSSAIVYLAWLLFSPILFCQTIVGAFIGNLIGMVLDDPPYTNLYTGGWAYNALLTSSAIGGLYYIFNLKSWLMSVVGSVLSTLVFAGMLKANLPTLGIPFMFITWVLIPATFNYQQEDTGTPTGVKKPIGSMNCAWNSNRRDDEPFMKKWMTLMRVPMDQVQTPEIHLMEHWKCHRKGIARIIPALSKVSAATAELHI